MAEILVVPYCILRNGPQWLDAEGKKTASKIKLCLALNVFMSQGRFELLCTCFWHTEYGRRSRRCYNN